MNAVTSIDAGQIDDIQSLMGDLLPEEHALRAKLRSYRNAATALVGSTESSNARCLAWMLIQTLTEWLYRPTDEATLRELARFSNRLLISATQAEALHDEGIAA